MSKKEAEETRQATIALLEKMNIDTQEERRIIKLIYSFTLSGFRESVAGRKAAIDDEE